jgi:GWxTD domain-containing protein
MLGYLRYYASPERLKALREAAPEARPAAWAAFLRASDPSSATPEHEGLREYFARVRAANLRFGDDANPGWMTDRGMTYIVLGEPDQIVDPTEQDPNTKGRTQVWEYRTEKLQLTFSDRGGFGQWRLTGPSASQLQAVMRRKLVP